MLAISKDAPQNDHYKQMWKHERDRRIEVEQENIRLRKIVYNTKFSITERAIALEITEQVKEAKHVDKQGRKLFSQKEAAEKLGLSRGTIGNGVDILTDSGFIKDKDTSALRDKEGKIIKGKDGRPITTIHLDIEQDYYEDFSKVERSEPRKIKENRKAPVFQCQKCLSEDVTIETSRHLVCRNPNCKACGEKVLIDVDYKDQISEPDFSSVQNLDTIELLDNSVQNLDTIELLDNSVQNLYTIPEEDSNNPPTSVSAPLDHTAIIHDWLGRRRGTDLIIVSTGSLISADKYITKTKGYEPDLDAFIAGNIAHIYGSRPRDPQTNKTWVLCFEIDDQAHDGQAQDYLVTLAQAGASPVYWQRYAQGRQRGHLELYFDSPVSPERARHWAYSICPDLEEIPECYPCQDKANNALSWPLYQRIGGQVYPCKALAILPAPHEGGLQEVDPTDKEQLASLITRAVTPASLVEEYAKRADELQTEQKRGQGQGNDQGGVIGNKRQPITQVGDKDLAKQVIADFNASHSWEDIAALCGGMNRGKFCAVWRGDKTPSVSVNRDGILAHDYGRTGSYPSTFDQYQVYCLIKGIDKKADLADRCAQLRRAEIKIVEAPATELFPTKQTEQKPPVYAICPICSTPKSVKREDGVYTCGTDHSKGE